MDGIDFLIEFLNDYYKAKLKNIHDIAGNVHLSGYSELYKKDLFVKIFSNKDMFYAEQHVNQVYYPEIYLDSVIFEDNYVVVLKDRQLEDTDKEKISKEQAYLYGNLLADFHNKLTGNVSVYEDKSSLGEQIDTLVKTLQNTEYIDNINDVNKIIKERLEKVQLEYELLPRVVLHGDFSIRNIKKYQDQVILIDFERSRIGIAYQDFVKFFFNEVKDLDLRNAFLKGYRENRPFEIPSETLQSVLLFKTALEILNFHLSHPEKKFGRMADDMLVAIKEDKSFLEL